MAERRMFAKTIIDSDSFLDMALSTQALYFHLSMRADDDGFINNPKKLCRMIGASDDEMKVLFAKKFLLGFESGVIVIKHWKMHNYIQKDRYKKTVYDEEMAQLGTSSNNGYTLDTECVQVVDTGKDRLELGKDRLELEVYKKDTFEHIVNHLNQILKSNYKSNGAKVKSLITARLNEGFTIEDFEQVHINKYAEWHNDEKMCKFLRPETLYGTKFESYLNQKITVNEKSRMVQDHTGLSPLTLLRQQGFAK